MSKNTGVSYTKQLLINTINDLDSLLKSKENIDLDIKTSILRTLNNLNNMMQIISFGDDAIPQYILDNITAHCVTDYINTQKQVAYDQDLIAKRVENIEKEVAEEFDPPAKADLDYHQWKPIEHKEYKRETESLDDLSQIIHDISTNYDAHRREYSNKSPQTNDATQNTSTHMPTANKLTQQEYDAMKDVDTTTSQQNDTVDNTVSDTVDNTVSDTVDNTVSDTVDQPQPTSDPEDDIWNIEPPELDEDIINTFLTQDIDLAINYEPEQTN